MSSGVRIAINGLAAATWLWLAWRTVRTGMPFGDPNWNPRRDERPFQFWLVVALYVGLGTWCVAQAVGV